MFLPPVILRFRSSGRVMKGTIFLEYVLLLHLVMSEWMLHYQKIQTGNLNTENLSTKLYVHVYTLQNLNVYIINSVLIIR